MKICIPHYTKLVDRRAWLERELAKHSLTAEWITDHDQEAISESEVAALVDQSLLEQKSAITGKYPRKPLNMAEVSIALKQLEIFRRHANSPEGYIVVFEDDIQFRVKNFATAFQKQIEKTPDDWDMIFFGDGGGLLLEKNPIRQLINRMNGRTVFRKNHPATRCLDSYAIKNSAAKRLGEAIDTIALPMDWELNYWIEKVGLTVYWWEPTLTFQGTHYGVWRSSIR